MKCKMCRQAHVCGCDLTFINNSKQQQQAAKASSRSNENAKYILVAMIESASININGNGIINISTKEAKKYAFMVDEEKPIGKLSLKPKHDGMARRL